MRAEDTFWSLGSPIRPNTAQAMVGYPWEPAKLVLIPGHQRGGGRKWTEGSEVSGAYLEPTASTLESLQAHADPIVGTSSFI